jgi:hypothetical protein
MTVLDAYRPDVMQVCRRGHVITDLLVTFPERARSHCERCGAPTLHQCLTCGQELPGAVHVPGAEPLGLRRPPQYCAACGAAFPWTERAPAVRGPGSLPLLEALLRRVPLVVRQLRVRQGEKQPFRVEDERDLEDLLRALLPIHFDDIRHEWRTPQYASGTCTDFHLGISGIVATAKLARASVRERDLEGRLQEDIAYYQRGQNCRALVYFVYDPEVLLREPQHLETAWAGLGDDLRVRAVIAS